MVPREGGQQDEPTLSLVRSHSADCEPPEPSHLGFLLKSQKTGCPPSILSHMEIQELLYWARSLKSPEGRPALRQLWKECPLLAAI